MTKKPFILNTTPCAEFRSPEQWVDWLNKAEASFPNLEPFETHIIATWMSYQSLNEHLGAWLGLNTLQDNKGVLSAFANFQSTLFIRIITSGFEVQTIAGLTILLSVFSSAYKLVPPSKKEYQICLDAAASVCARLTHEAYHEEYSGNVVSFPTTIH